MPKMYLQSDSSGYGLLIPDGEKWYYFHEGEFLHIPLNAETEEKNAEIIRKAIASNELYDAEDFISEHKDDEEYIIPSFEGLTLEDIDHKVNDKLACDYTTWVEI